jgi:hypothetical protein
MEATFRICRFLFTEEFLVEFSSGSADCGCKAIPSGSKGIGAEAARAVWARARSALQERRLLMLPIGEHKAALFFRSQQAGLRLLAVAVFAGCACMEVAASPGVVLALCMQPAQARQRYALLACVPAPHNACLHLMALLST